MNIRVNLNTNIADGSEVVFRSPADCSQVTGLVIYHAGGKTEFAFADAHGNNVGDIDHLFAENAVVKVILDVTAGMAFVQNADTNAYIEGTFIKSVNGKVPEEGKVELNAEDVGALSKDALREGVNLALKQAKESGAFDGNDGEDYILTDEDKKEIADLIPVPKGSGIYIGSGDMPEGYDVQIDPEGEPLDLDEFLTEDEVDEAIDKALGSFDGDGLTEERVNEMISEALEDIDLPEMPTGGEKEWELIDVVTISEPVQKFILSGFSYKEILMIFSDALCAPKEGMSAPNNSGAITVILNGRSAGANSVGCWHDSVVSKGVLIAKFVGADEIYHPLVLLSNGNGSGNYAGSGIMAVSRNFPSAETTDEIISVELRMASYNVMNITGGTFRVYGR